MTTDSVLIETTFQTSTGVPITGLIPTIIIFEVSNDDPTIEAVNDSMVEVGNGLYVYNFTPRDFDKYYFAHVDGTATVTNGWQRNQYADVSKYRDKGGRIAL